MKCKIGLALVFAAVTVGGYAQAGPKVTVVFKNNSDMEAVYSPQSRNEMLTRTFAVKKPDNTVSAGGRDTFVVEGKLSPDVTTANLRYTAGSKICTFMSTYVMGVGKGTRLPQWNKKAEASDGARCDAKITHTNPSSHEWTVEFTMR
jgi:hypothetical protein